MKLSLLVFVLMTAASSTIASTYNIALTQDGLGDDGSDWFGTLTADDDGIVTSASILVEGVTYDYIFSEVSDPYGPPRINPPGAPLDPADFGETVLAGTIGSAPFGPELEPALFISYGIDFSGPFFTKSWCSGVVGETLIGCAGGEVLRGSYEIVSAPAPIPLPASLPLLFAGLGLLAFSRFWSIRSG